MTRRFDPTAPLSPGVTFLEASAGTGKTWTITSLFVRLVAELGIEVREILVVTFTRAATAELRERVRQRLREAVAAVERARGPAGGTPPEDDPLLAHIVELAAREDVGRSLVVSRLRRALEGFDEATISTIHGFCQRMLQHHAFESGAPFEAELLTDLEPLVEEVLEDFWTREIHDAPEVFVNHLKARRVSLRELRDLARRAAYDRDLRVLPEGEDPDATGLTGDHDDDALTAWTAAVRDLRSVWALESEEAIGMLRFASERRKADLRALEGRRYNQRRNDQALRRFKGWLDGRAHAVDLDWSAEYLCASEMARYTREGRNPPAHRLFDLIEQVVQAGAAAVVALDRRALGLKRRLVDWVRLELDKRKFEREALGFDDLLRILRTALADPQQGPTLAGHIREEFRAALIDEFQDTDVVQWSIFQHVFAHPGHHLYLVGDPKQAIYGFRGADVYAYLRARDREAGGSSLWTLETNYRSDGPLVDALGHLFQQPGLDDPFLEPAIRYVPVAAHHQKARLEFPGPGPQRPPLVFSFIRRELAQCVEGTAEISRTWAERTLPTIVAQQIVATLNSGATLPMDDPEADDSAVEAAQGGVPDGAERRRPITPGDCAVLVRSNAQATAMQHALRQVGVPSVVHGAESVLRSHEAEELLRVMRGIQEFSSVRAMKAALATDLLGVSAAELGDLEEDEVTWTRWVRRLRGWRDRWHKRGFVQMFRALLAELEVPARLLAWRDGERRLTNLLHLAELLHEAAVERDLHPTGLIAWLRRERQAGTVAEESRQLRLESDADSVTVSTVHRSKGLQYPLVWCPFAWDRAGLRWPEDTHVRFHDPAAGGQRTLRVSLFPTDYADPARDAAAELATREARAEALRLFYVAVTRAKHRCTIVWGAFSGAGTSPLGHLLHGRDDVDPVHQPDAALLHKLQQLGEAAGGHIGHHCAAGPRPGVWYQRAQGVERPLQARVWRRGPPLDRLWRRASFSQMAHGAHAEGGDVHDYDARTPDAEPDEAERASQVPADGRRVVMADFPAGAQAGTCLHKVLELHDFRAGPDALEALGAEQLRRHGFDPVAWTAPLVAGLTAALDTPLEEDGSVRLRDLDPADRLDELDFVFPSLGGLDARGGRAVSSEELAALFARRRSPVMPADYPTRVRALGFPGVRGFIVGSVDLAFRHGQRWYVVDYKSNRLGEHPLHYQPGLLAREMAERHYFLQYHLYCVALHRYLAWRQPGYRYERHFGGVRYLFLRGMDPSHAEDVGVFRDRPAKALVEELSALLGGDV